MFYVVLVLFLSQYHTILPSLIFGNLPSIMIQVILVLLVSITILLKSKKGKIISIDVKYLILILLMLFFQLLRSFTSVDKSEVLLYVLIYISTPFLLYFLINSYINGKKDLRHLLKPYLYLNNYVAIISIFIFVLSLLGIIDVGSYSMPQNINLWVDNNTTNLGSRYLFPLNMAVIIDTNRIPFFNNYGIFCGVSHEPHIATLFLTPAFFLLGLVYKGYKLLLLRISYVFFMLLAASVTNVLIFAPLFFIFYLLDGYYKSKLTKKLIIIIPFVLIIFTSLLFFQPLIDFISLKLTNKGGSLDYSQNMLLYILEPKSFLGYGVWRIPYPHLKIDDIGFIGSFFMIIVFVIFFRLSILNVFKKSSYLVGIAGLYFLFHSFKVPQLSLLYPFTYYMFFLLIIFNKYEKS